MFSVFILSHLTGEGYLPKVSISKNFRPSKLPCRLTEAVLAWLQCQASERGPQGRRESGLRLGEDLIRVKFILNRLLGEILALQSAKPPPPFASSLYYLNAVPYNRTYPGDDK